MGLRGAAEGAELLQEAAKVRLSRGICWHRLRCDTSIITFFLDLNSMMGHCRVFMALGVGSRLLASSSQ